MQTLPHLTKSSRYCESDGSGMQAEDDPPVRRPVLGNALAIEVAVRQLRLDVGIARSLQALGNQPKLDEIADDPRGARRRQLPVRREPFRLDRHIVGMALHVDEIQLVRSEEPRVGKEWVSTCRCRGWPYH